MFLCWEEPVLFWSVLILGAVLPWKPPIIIILVQKFDHIYQTWLGFWSQSDLQNMKFQRWYQELHFKCVLMRIFWFHLLFSIEIYQLFLLFFEILIRWRNIVLEFGIQVIFIRWRFIGESKKFMASSRFQRYFLPYLGTRRGLVPILYR